MLLAFPLLAPMLLAHRYQLCNFSCPDGNWTACRAEKCDAQLLEDGCSDGSEALIADEAGVAVTGQRSAQDVDVPVAGSSQTMRAVHGRAWRG